MRRSRIGQGEMLHGSRCFWVGGFAAGMAACIALSLPLSPARGETLESALVQAYQNNPSLNSQRAGDARHRRGRAAGIGRLSPEGHGRPAAAASRPRRRRQRRYKPGVGTWSTLAGYNSPASVGATITQTLYNGFQTANKTRQAESAVLAARATLRVTEQTVLLNAATAYMNLLRDSAILDLQRRNVEVLQEQLRQTRDRFNVGEVTRTDVAQAESSLAAGRSQVLLRRSQLHRFGRDLSAGDRRRAGQAGAGHAGRPLLAA